MGSGADADESAVVKCLKSPKSVGCFGCFMFIFLFIFLPISFSGVEYYEVALKYSTTSGIVAPKSYEHGNHFIGPINAFHKFPATAQSFESKSFAVFTKSDTGNGATVNIDISFQYILIPDKLFDLYRLTGMEFADIITAQATAKIKNTASQYTNIQFLQSRVMIENKLKEALTEKLLEVHAKVIGFQLRKIVFASTFITTQLNTAIQQIKSAEEEFKKTAAVTRAQSQSQSEQVKNEGGLLLSQATASASLLKVQAASTALSTVETARNAGLANLYSTLGVTAAADKASLDYLLMLQEKMKETGSAAPKSVYVDFTAANTFK